MSQNKLSLVYRNIWLYRAVMNILYLGRYRSGYDRAAALLRAADVTVLDLCFGDVRLAEYCRRAGKKWIGLDINESFIRYARRKGFDARYADLLRGDPLPDCDVCVMLRSLYHFQAVLPELFKRIKAVSGRLILAEPVRNWTNSGGLLQFLARQGTRARAGGKAAEENFRFTETTLRAALDELQNQVGFTYRIVSIERDMTVEILFT